MIYINILIKRKFTLNSIFEKEFGESEMDNKIKNFIYRSFPASLISKY